MMPPEIKVYVLEAIRMEWNNFVRGDTSESIVSED